MAVGDNLTGTNRDAFLALKSIFDSYGLGSLAPDIVNYLQNGYSSETIGVLLQSTAAYKKRFAANEARVKKGLPALSPQEYLATETAYRQVMRAAGLPNGFYDKNDDFQKFLENDVSPQEIQSRVTAAANFIDSASSEQKALFSQWYTKGDMIAYALDPQRAAPLVGKAFTTAQIGGEAVTHGLGIDQNMAETLTEKGVTADQASQGFGVIQSTLGNDQKLAAMSGDSISGYDAMREVFLNDASVTKRRDRLASQERARFGGSSAVGAGSLGQSTAGQL
ncbi:hypothetical protein UB45_07785 [Terrabacter sp. 28]|nr:hypothetical protein UB45_07785 [Terrabacter sp. 28]